MLDVAELNQAIESKNTQLVADIIKKHQLKIVDNKITADKEVIRSLEDFWDRRQLIKKILLNSLYGSIGNPASKWFDERIAQSTTLTGRCIVRHMGSKINEIIDGDYNYKGRSVIYGDTDSIAQDSIIRTNIGDKSVEDMFLNGTIFWQEGDKEYSRNDDIKVMSYSQETNTAQLSKYDYVYRHKVKKKKFKITTSGGKSVVVTEDHSVMVLLDGVLIEKKPIDLTKDDIIIAL